MFHTDADAPEGYMIIWSTGASGSTCTIDSAVNGEYRIRADLVRTADNVVVSSSKEETVTVNTGFFAKIIAFFRQLFGALPVYEDNIRK